MVSPQPDPPELTNSRKMVEILTVTVVYVAAARLGLLLAFTHRNISPVWPPSGVAFAALLFFKLRPWPGITLGAFLANYSTGIPFGTSCAIATGNTLEGVFATYFIQHSGWFQPSLSRRQDVLLLIAASALSPIPASSIGATAICLAGMIPFKDYFHAFLIWWFGDAMGILVIGSMLVSWFPVSPRSARKLPGITGMRIVETVGYILLISLVLYFIFGSGKEYRYALFPVMVWAAFRFGQRGVTLAATIVSVVAVWGTLRGLGPFVRSQPEQSLVYLQTFMAVLSGMSMVLAALIMERNKAEDELRESESRFKLALEHSGITVYSQDRDLKYTWLYDGQHRFDLDRVIGYSDADIASDTDAAALTEIKRRVLKTGIGERRQVSFTAQGSPKEFDLIVEPVQDADGKIAGVRGVANDITEIKQYQNQIEALNERLRRSMRETHHRVKNNLQIIAAMVDMRLMGGVKQVPADEVRQLAMHTQTLAAVHDLLTQETHEGDMAHAVSASVIIEKLVPMLQSASKGNTLSLSADEVRLPLKQTTSLAIIVNELVGNAIKHGAGAINITLRCNSHGVVLEVTDHGAGFPPGFDLQTSSKTGLKLVDNLSKWDLAGGVVCSTLPSGGGSVTVSFPSPP